MPGGSRYAVYVVLVYLALEREQRGSPGPCFNFSKSEFIRAYWRLRRANAVEKVKIETLLRMLRRMASEARIVRYAGEQGVYTLCRPSLEEHQWWHAARASAVKALAKG